MMEYKLPDMDRFLIRHVTPGNWVDMMAQELMRQYAEQAVAPLLSEIERLEKLAEEKYREGHDEGFEAGYYSCYESMRD